MTTPTPESILADLLGRLYDDQPCGCDECVAATAQASKRIQRYGDSRASEARREAEKVASDYAARMLAGAHELEAAGSDPMVATCKASAGEDVARAIHALSDKGGVK